MTLLTIAKGLALNVGLPAPSQVNAAPGREWAEVVQFANETGEELARRVQWGELNRTADVNGGVIAADFDRMVEGVAVRASGKIVRPLTRAEWNDLPPAAMGEPRYFLLERDRISVWPAGMVKVSYQSRNWTDADTDAFTADGQSPLMDEALFLKGLVARWRRQKSMPYADEEAEYEAALAEYAQDDNRSRL